MRTRSAILSGCLALLLAADALGAPPGGEPRVLFVLDASDSMNLPLATDISAGNLRLTTTFDKAKADLISQIPALERAGTPMGLMVFAHRDGSCIDIELMHSIEPGQGALITSSVELVQARGRTPLTRAIEIAGKLFKEAPEHKYRLVIQSDGWDGCGGDPVKAVKDIKASGVNLTVDLTLFNATDDPDISKLAEVAKAGGGKYREVRLTSMMEGAADNAMKVLDDAFKGIDTQMGPLPKPNGASKGAPPDDAPVQDPASIPRELSFGGKPPKAQVTPGAKVTRAKPSPPSPTPSPSQPPTKPSPEPSASPTAPAAEPLPLL